jgi:hypothetical protein
MKINWGLCITSALVSFLFSYSQWSRAEMPVADFGVAVGKPLPFYAIAGMVPTGMFNFFYLFVDLMIVFALVLTMLTTISWDFGALIKKRLC